jgi:low temperature requirement protein LtrA
MLLMIYISAFTDSGHHNAYSAFYIVAVAEIGGNIIVSSMWKAASFKRTHLIQRMSLLTLIILGEGVIVICKNISTVSFTSSILQTLFTDDCTDCTK